jgi:hypothetical protein
MGSGIIIAACVVFGILAFLLLRHITAASQAISNERRVAAERSYALENLSSLKKQAPEADQYSKKIEALLPHEDGLFSFPEFMESVARVHGLESTFSFDGQPVSAAGTRPGYVVFAYTVTGSADGIQSLLADLEQKTTKFLVGIDAVNLAPNDSSYRAEMRGKVYFQ